MSAEPIGVYGDLTRKRERVLGGPISDATRRRIQGLRPSYERAVSHCIVVDLRTGERTVTNETPPPPPPPPAPTPKPTQLPERVDRKGWWKTPEGLQNLRRREMTIGSVELTVADIMAFVAEVAAENPGDRYPFDDFFSPRRSREVSWPRQVAIALCCEFRRDISLPALGHLFRGMDHTTVMHAVRKIEERRVTEPWVDRMYHHAKAKILAKKTKIKELADG